MRTRQLEIAYAQQHDCSPFTVHCEHGVAQSPTDFMRRALVWTSGTVVKMRETQRGDPHAPFRPCRNRHGYC